MTDGKISIGTVTERFNQGRTERDQVRNDFIGRQSAKLGFEKCKLTHGLRGFYWNLELIERLKQRYCVPPSRNAPLAPQASLAPLLMGKTGSESGRSGTEHSEPSQSSEHENDGKGGTSGTSGTSGAFPEEA